MKKKVKVVIFFKTHKGHT